MNIPKTALLTALVLAVALSAGCSASRRQDAAEKQEKLALAAVSQPLAASFSDARVSGMKGIADNGKLRLLVDEKSGAIAVIHKESNQIWHSNPPSRDQDSLAAGVNKDWLSSQLKIDYYNALGQINSMNSYSDSAAYGQIGFEPIEQGVRVNYQFGKAQRTFEDLPLMVSKARFDELSAKLDKTGQRALIIGYKEDTGKQLYLRNDSALVGLQLDRAIKAFEDAGYTAEELEADMRELGFTQSKPEPRIFMASIEYRLDGEMLVANIPQSRIHFPSQYPINSISMLGTFGAGGKDEQGAIFVPDGSGALIRFNNGKAKYPTYHQAVYGMDRAMETKESATPDEKVRLPVFGIIREDRAFLGIIEAGAPVASISADVAGRTNSYNVVYPSFIVVNKGDVTLSGQSRNSTLPKFQESATQSDFTVRYSFLNGQAASYQGMAELYRSYLIRTNGLPQVESKSGKEPIPFYLQLVGGISKEKHFAGIPYHSMEPLTTFKQARSIVEELRQRGIGEIKLKYSGWFNGGQNHAVLHKVEVDNGIGGSKGLQQFSSFALENKVSVYPDVALLTANSTSGFSKSGDSARTLKGVPAALYPVDLALNGRDRSASPSYVVSPRLVGGYTDTLLKAADSYRLGRLSLRDLTDQLDSDFRKNRQIDRTESEAVSVKALAKLKESGLRLMGEGGNAYALPYLTDITNAPLSNSGFKIEDESIPFYQLVIRGMIDYTGAPYNLSTHTSPEQYVLKCLEYGAHVSFEWIYEPNHKIKDTEFSRLYAVYYGDTLELAARMYRQVNEVLEKVAGESIVGHQKLGEGVYKTVYSNKRYIIVNYNTSPVTVDGRTIGAESYMMGGGEA